MSTNGITRPVTDDEAAQLGPVVADLLRIVPEAWGEHDAAKMTAAQERALFLLTAAEMVERRLRIRVSMATAPTSLEAVLTATGERGFLDAMRPLLAKAWGLWEDRYKAWSAGDAGETPPIIVESVPPHEWRLTSSGIDARNDLDAGLSAGIDFVLWRGAFDGCHRVLPDGLKFQRPHVPGYGKLESLVEHAVGPELPRVNTANWAEGADAIAARIVPELGALVAEYFKAHAPMPAAPSAGPSQLGFLGGTELCDALDVHRSRRDAFQKQLERERNALMGSGDCREVRQPPPNTPTFLYRVSAVAEIAKGYRTSKAG